MDANPFMKVISCTPWQCFAGHLYVRLIRPVIRHCLAILALPPSRSPPVVAEIDDHHLSSLIMRRRRKGPPSDANRDDHRGIMAPDTTNSDSSRHERDDPAPASPQDLACDSDDFQSLLSNNEDDDDDDTRKISEPPRVQPQLSFQVTKFVILRLMGFVYLIAFIGAYHQNRGLMGKNGLMPAHHFMDHLRLQHDSPIKGFVSHPTLFWFLPTSTMEDWHMECIAAMGATLSLAVLMGLNSWIVMVVLWLLDFTIVTIAEGATEFYSYGWESQLLETGFLSIWLCDLPLSWGRNRNFIDLFRDTTDSTPSLPVLWLFRWLCARISIGAGLIKLRGASCWQERTCLYYHFETQPIPSPLSLVFHFLPKLVLRRAVDLDYFVQLYSVWMVLLPGLHWLLIYLRRLGGFIQAGFMINIILSGNFAFLNHLTIIPALAALDDDCFPGWMKKFTNQRSGISESKYTNTGFVRKFVDFSLLALIGLLSVPVVSNFLQSGGKHQLMNASFNSFKLVNSYGAFGSVGKARYEPIVSLSNDGTNWTELEFPCKPGKIDRRPCFCAPYHYRLDWNIWFIGFKPHEAMLQQRERWLYSLLQHILADSAQSDRPWLSLLDKSARDLLENGPMRYAKVDMFGYKMKESLWNILMKKLRGLEVHWWHREFEETLIPPVQLHEVSRSLMYAKIIVT
eukprot:CCRYP_001300-RA/>CCRYP_001300-RA protein AED:0.02 eAED:0.02 QI:0/1/0.5/1/1/1/2/260/680